MTITVPFLPAGQDITGWRKTVQSVEADQRGGHAVTGDWLEPGDVAAVPAGTLILTVDKRTTGWDTHYKTGERYAVQDATVTVHLADGGALTELWSRHYKQAASALGPTTLKKLAALLAKHPAPEGAVKVVKEARRPNRKAGHCRWCGGPVSARSGHLVGHGDQTEVEHWETCPSRAAVAGTPCALCGVTVTSTNAFEYLVREEPVRRETRHRPSYFCTDTPPASYEEQQEALAAARDEERRQADLKHRREQAAADRKAKRDQKRRAAIAAETERVAGLTVTARTETEVYSKRTAPGERAQLLEYRDELEDGTTTTRWAVVTVPDGSGWTGEDYDPAPVEEVTVTLDKEAARDAYRSLKWTPGRRSSHGYSDGSCDECHQGTARHTRYDSSGIRGKVCDRCDREEDYMLSFA